MGYQPSKISHDTRVGPYRVEEKQIYNFSNYPGGKWEGKWALDKTNTMRYNSHYQCNKVAFNLLHNRLECLRNIRKAVIDGRVDILDEIYSKKNLIGYIELNDWTSYMEYPLLYEASSRNHYGVVEWLLDHGIPDHGTFTMQGWKYAVDATTSSAIRDMIAKKSDINMKAYLATKELQRSRFYMDEVYITFLSHINN